MEVQCGRKCASLISDKVCFVVRLELCKIFPLLALGGIFCRLHNMCALSCHKKLPNASTLHDLVCIIDMLV